MTAWIFFGLAMAGVLAFLSINIRAWGHRNQLAMERARKHLEGRMPRDCLSFAETFFEGDDVLIAAYVFHFVLENHWMQGAVDLNRIHPDDRLADDLSLFQCGHPQDAISFFFGLTRELDVNCRNLEASLSSAQFTIRSLVDCIRWERACTKRQPVCST